jgi:hypothetical protein
VSESRERERERERQRNRKREGTFRVHARGDEAIPLRRFGEILTPISI